jgi:hypothetical protein
MFINPSVMNKGSVLTKEVRLTLYYISHVSMIIKWMAYYEQEMRIFSNKPLNVLFPSCLQSYESSVVLKGALDMSEIGPWYAEENNVGDYMKKREEKGRRLSIMQ